MRVGDLTEAHLGLVVEVTETHHDGVGYTVYAPAKLVKVSHRIHDWPEPHHEVWLTLRTTQQTPPYPPWRNDRPIPLRPDDTVEIL